VRRLNELPVPITDATTFSLSSKKISEKKYYGKVPEELLNTPRSNTSSSNSSNTMGSIVSTTESTLTQLMNDNTVWKVLIYDQFGQDVIAPLLRVADLRDNGVTFHMYTPAITHL
jgi:hypothetical protein